MRRAIDWQREGEGAASPWSGFRPELPTMPLDDRFADEQAETRALGGRCGS